MPLIYTPAKENFRRRRHQKNKPSTMQHSLEKHKLSELELWRLNISETFASAAAFIKEQAREAGSVASASSQLNRSGPYVVSTH
jgi:hypothetical protein